MHREEATPARDNNRAPARESEHFHRQEDKAAPRWSLALSLIAAGAADIPPNRVLTAADMLDLQRTVGNRQAQRVILGGPQRDRARCAPAETPIQRQPAPPPAPDNEDPVARAIRTNDPLDITAIEDYSKVSEADRLKFVQILNRESSEAISKGHMIRIWQSFGDQLGAVAMKNRAIWDESVGVYGGDATVILPKALVDQKQSELEADIKALAVANLEQNEDFVDRRMENMGLKPGTGKPFEKDDITKIRRAEQEIAYSVWGMRKSQKKLENTPIGTQLRKGTGLSGILILMGKEEEEVRFDPHNPPKNPETFEVWKQLKEDWDKAEIQITASAGAYPEIYEAVAEDDDDKLLHFSRVTPEAFAGEQRTLLQALIDRIKEVEGMVDGGDLDLLAFEPAIRRLTAGGAKWAGAFEQYMADLLLKRHSENQAAMQKLFTVLKLAPLFLAPISSTGIGAILEAVAIGASVTIASVEYKQASAQAEAARATPILGTELLSRSEADAAKAKATADLIEASVIAIIAAIGAAAAGIAKLADVVQMARLKAVVKNEALLGSLLTKIPDKGQLYRIAAAAGDVTKLEDLVAKIPDAARLEAMLTKAGGAVRLLALLEKVPASERLAKMLDVADGARLETMFQRLGSPEAVDEALARQARGEAEGLQDVEGMRRMAKGAQSLADAWDSLTPQQRLEMAEAELNAELQVQGVPPIKAQLAESAASSGQWSGARWSVSVDPGLAAEKAAGGSAQKLSSTLYHEGRHAEQDFLVGRLKAGEGTSAEELSYPRSEGGIGMRPDVAQQAAASKLPPNSPQAALAREMEQAGVNYPPSRYQAIIDKRYDAMVAKGEAEFELRVAQMRAEARPDQPYPAAVIRALRNRVKEAGEAFDIADKAYRGVPFEKDAFTVEAEFEKHLEAAMEKP